MAEDKISLQEQKEAGKASFFAEYGQRIKAFSKNARLYLLGSILLGIIMGVYRLLFNFYVLSLGFDQEVLGTLVSFNHSASLIAALPAALLINKIGKRNAFIWGNVLTGLGIGVMLIFHTFPVFAAMSVVIGLGQTVSVVGLGPFLMENSSNYERTYLFSVASGLNMTAGSIGEWVGGYMPTWFGGILNVGSTAAPAYSATLAVVSVGALFSLIPYLFIQEKNHKLEERPRIKFDYFRTNPKDILRFILPLLLTSIGAGMIMPFMNVFFRTVHGLTDSAIGMYFAWGALAMGVGLLLAPAIAEKYGKLPTVVISQGLSIPFLVLLGFSPYLWLALTAYYFRSSLMNMSSPVYSTYVMEHVPDDSRAMMASLSSMSNNFGWAISPIFSGLMQIKGGFTLPFLTTITFYSIAILLYYFWHWRKPKPVTV